MSLVTEILTTDQIHDLWGAGYTIVRRPADPFEVDPKIIPHGMSYQWNDSQEKPGWSPVLFEDHDGAFGPFGMRGPVYRDNLFLCKRPKAEAEHDLERARTKAQQNVADWASKNAALGLTGSVTVGTQTAVGKLDSLKKVKVGDLVEIDTDEGFAQVGSTKTIETIVAIPRDMTPHIPEIFKERDRLEAEVVRKDRTLAPGPIADKFYAAVEADKGAPWWPTLRAILLPIAVDNVRANLKKETTDE
jgi:hypothetical protein